MITVRYWDGDDGSVNLRLHGHAGAGKKGHDLVCAAASTLALTLGRAVEIWADWDWLAGAAQVQLEEGNVEITAIPRAARRLQVDAVFWTVLLGLFRLEEGYPQYVQVREGEDDE